MIFYIQKSQTKIRHDKTKKTSKRQQTRAPRRNKDKQKTNDKDKIQAKTKDKKQMSEVTLNFLLNFLRINELIS
jgi:hypothetical protein